MLFQHTFIPDIISGKKRQTRRLVKPGECFLSDFLPGASSTEIGIAADRQIVGMTIHKFSAKYSVGRRYAVQPGRGKNTVMVAPLRTVEGVDHRVVTESDGEFLWSIAQPLRIEITALGREDVRFICEEDAHDEGFQSPEGFLRLWTKLYDPKAHLSFDDSRFKFKTGLNGEIKFDFVLFKHWLMCRPEKFYDAWVLTFEVKI